MISCRDAHHLFDRYLDGELSPSLQTELHAHRLNCTECQNELALLEACGDVVALDRREPVLSASFTDRVLLARRAQAIPVRRVSWTRRLVVLGSPMAAAASIALAVMTIAPVRTTRVATRTEALPTAVQERMVAHPMSEQARKELAETPVLPAASIIDTLLGPVVQKSRDTLEGTKRGAEDLAILFSNLAEDQKKLVAIWKEAHPEVTAPTASDPSEPRMELRFGQPFGSPQSGERDMVFDPL
jgi:anti-sigma factor RsiW